MNIYEFCDLTQSMLVIRRRHSGIKDAKEWYATIDRAWEIDPPFLRGIACSADYPLDAVQKLSDHISGKKLKINESEYTVPKLDPTP